MKVEIAFVFFPKMKNIFSKYDLGFDNVYKKKYVHILILMELLKFIPISFINCMSKSMN